MHDARNRQLSPACAALLWALASGIGAASAEEKSAPAQELQALRILEAALHARQAGPDDWKKFGSAYADLAKRNPRDVSIRVAHGEYLWGMEDRDGALREWRAAEKLDPQNFGLLNRLGDAALALGDPREALKLFLRASDVQPAHALTHFNIGNVAFLFRKAVDRTEAEAFALALAHFAEAHRLAPENAEFARGYAETFYLLPNPDWPAALKAWQDYLAIAPEKDFARRQLARIHRKLGEEAKARAYLEEVSSNRQRAPR